MSNIEMKVSGLGQSYWNDSGAYNELQKKCYDNLVPSEGEADTIHGEVLRCANAIYWDYFNNGNGNARNEIKIENDYCYDEDNYGNNDDEEYEYEVGERYLQMMQVIIDSIGTNEVSEIMDKICEIIVDGYETSYNEISVNVYDSLIDHVMYFILTTDNSPYVAE